MPLYLFYTMVQKKSKMTKNSNQRGGPALKSNYTPRHPNLWPDGFPSIRFNGGGPRSKLHWERVKHTSKMARTAGFSRNGGCSQNGAGRVCGALSSQMHTWMYGWLRAGREKLTLGELLFHEYALGDTYGRSLSLKNLKKKTSHKKG